ncbi:MAG: DUF262 domain-containing HNH endonuclease family protein [Pseudomonadota bacterium]
MAFDFNMDNKSFIQLMGNGVKYSVPKFQRDYSWREEHWEDLWSDINNNDNISPWHYMGYLLLQPDAKDVHQHKIIDGQQRIATTTIIILAILNELQVLINSGNEPDDNKKRQDAIRSRYIVFTDPISLQSQAKLTLNRNNNRFFRKLCSMDEPMFRNAKPSEMLMFEALKFYRKRIRSEITATGEELAKFVSKLEDKLFFTTIEVKNDLNAYTVFETLNARGVKLSTPDLVKNYLFSQIDKEENTQNEELDQLDEDWEAILSQLGRDGDFSRFIQVEWNSRHHPKTQKTGLFREIKSHIKDKNSACDYVKKLEKAAPIYAALENPDDSLWKDYEKENNEKISNSIKTLKCFSIKQPHGLLMAAYLNFLKEDFLRIAAYIEVISIRYNAICRGHPNEQEDIYNKIACDISNGILTSPDSIKDRLKDVYKNDREFIEYFELKSIKTQPEARYILERIEEYLKPNHKVSYARSTLEHILPKNPSDDWLEFFTKEVINESIYRLGNMTLLEKEENRKVANKLYSEKIKVYATSDYEITKQCAEHEIWNKDAVLNRQKWLAEQAVKCWRIDFE